MKRKIIDTSDGSHTLFVPELEEHYHSIHGAIQESKHVFIEAGLRFLNKTNVSILEIGFGTGLNALLTCIDGQKNARKIIYDTIELYPLSSEEIKQLNYGKILGGNAQDFFTKIHNADWDKTVIINSLQGSFLLHKIYADLLDYSPTGKYDLVFFDAFGPDKQAEMWQPYIFEKIAKTMNSKGLLLTYSAKGDVKRALRAAGFKVKLIPGPPGKREMIRAIFP